MSDESAPTRARWSVGASWRNLDPRRLLVLLTTVFVAVTLTAWSAFVLHDRAVVLEAANQQLHLMARLVTATTFRTVQGGDLVLRKIQREIESRGFASWTADPGAWLRLNAAAQTLPQAGALFVIGVDGRSVAHSNSSTTPTVFLGDRDYFQVHARTRTDTPYVGHRVSSRIGDRQIIGISRRLAHEDGSFAGVIAAAIDIAYFDHFFASLPLTPGSAITILRDDGGVFFEGPPPTHTPPCRTWPAAPSGAINQSYPFFPTPTTAHRWRRPGRRSDLMICWWPSVGGRMTCSVPGIIG